VVVVYKVCAGLDHSDSLPFGFFRHFPAFSGIFRHFPWADASRSRSFRGQKNEAAWVHSEMPYNGT
jgi:hypothetical protein